MKWEASKERKVNDEVKERLKTLPPTYKGFSTADLMAIIKKTGQDWETPCTQEDLDWDANLPQDMRVAADDLAHEYLLTPVAMLIAETEEKYKEEYRDPLWTKKPDQD